MESNATDLRAQLAAVIVQQMALSDEGNRLRLAIEEAEGRPDSLDARFSRALIARDVEAMDEARAESLAAFVVQYGELPDARVQNAALERANNLRPDRPGTERAEQS